MTSRAGAAGPRNAAIDVLFVEAKRLCFIQLVLTIVVGAGFMLSSGEQSALAAVFGGLIALVNGWVMGRTVLRATEFARRSPGSETWILYLGAMKRFALVGTAFALGIGGIELLPVPLIVGFAVVHGAFFLGRAFIATNAAGKD
jgi:ATP synthase protein I